MSGSYLKIDSADRINPGSTTPANFVINGNIVLHGRYAVKAVYYPTTFFNINTDLNNTIYFTEAGVAKVAVMQPGFYSGFGSLLPAIKSAMDTASAGVNTFTVTQSALTGLISIAASTVAFQITFGSNQVSAAFEVLGFSKVDTAIALLLTANNYPNLASVRSLNININNIGCVSDMLNSNNSTVCVPILQNPPSGIGYWEPPPTFPQVFQFDTPTRVLKISVLDDKQALLPLQSEWHMIVQKLC